MIEFILYYFFIESLLPFTLLYLSYGANFTTHMSSEIAFDNMHKIIREYYRGSSYGKIVDIQKINNDYCFITNCDKTIHIYSLKEKKSKNLSSFLTGFVIDFTSFSLAISGSAKALRVPPFISV